MATGTKVKIELPIRRKASLELCANECGAMCCRAPFHFILTRKELEKLAELGNKIGISKLMTEHLDDDQFSIAFENNDGICPFLDEKNNFCKIYSDRPKACRKFPEHPFKGCLVWALP